MVGPVSWGKTIRWFSATVLFCLGVTAPSGVLAKGGETEQVYAQFKDRVLQIQVLDLSSGSKTTIGSGFLAAPGGAVVTNFHVIAALINQPGRYRAEYVDQHGDRGPLNLVNLDVVHDLALLRGEGLTGRPLQVAGLLPEKGERLFAFGNPHDIGLTIVEGTYNGLLERSLYEKIHFTGSINPGMSGGPTVNRAGDLVGVNVSTAGNQVSFLVPACFVAALVGEPVVPGNFSEVVRRQLLANQEQYLAPLLAKPFPTASLSDYRLPGELAAYVRCWGNTPAQNEELYQVVLQSCATDDEIFLDDHLTTGEIRFRHELYSTSQLNPVRFFGLLKEKFNQPGFHFGGAEENVSNFSCQTDFVANGSLDSKLVFCLRRYKKFDGLYDAFLTATTLVGPQEALHTSLGLTGVSIENALRFSQHFLESLQWKR